MSFFFITATCPFENSTSVLSGSYATIEAAAAAKRDLRHEDGPDGPYTYDVWVINAYGTEKLIPLTSEHKPTRHI